MSKKKQKIAIWSRMIWVSCKYASINIDGGKSESIIIPVQGTYIRAKHGPIGVELDRIDQQNEQQNGR